MLFEKPKRFVSRVFLHCSASDHASHDNIETIRRWHTDPKPAGNGWSDVGYHFFIRKDGMLEPGRPLEKTPAAQLNHNKSTIAICLHGLDVRKFTEAQFEKLKALCLEINQAYAGALSFHGHREVASKACPVFDYKGVLRLNEWGQLGIAGAVTTNLMDDTHRDAATMPVLTHGTKGKAVALVQSLLMVKDDGIFGPRTDAAVREFQEEKGLARDGTVGEDTWKALFANERIEHSGKV